MSIQVKLINIHLNQFSRPPLDTGHSVHVGRYGLTHLFQSSLVSPDKYMYPKGHQKSDYVVPTQECRL